MSLNSWKKEFYGKMSDAKKSEIKALQHSIQKWTGLLKKNLKKHKCNISFVDIYDDGDEPFSISGDTCALCERHRNSSNIIADCGATCSLGIYREGYACDWATDKEYSSPWWIWRNKIKRS